GEAIVQHALDAFGRLDILVNNAGNMRLSSFAKLDVATIDEVLDVHLGGTFYLSKPAWTAMAAQKSGRIIFTGSGLGAVGIYGAGVYAAAKGGIAGLLNVLELESERHGIKVNGVAPMAQTRMVNDDLYSEVPATSVSPDLVAPVVVYLASDECAVNGEMWSVGAGSVARLFTGRTKGYFKHPAEDGPLTAEDVSGHTAEIMDTAGFSEPPNWPAEWQMVAKLNEEGSS
ncbi:MAG TPA: SDR family NAD(P)-dependent oxidoreductase, partial [Solirubrobacterales bacterium]|nr:SDR family NAD(P)-dependent oxidoreductase [Solirubrobacterales bacterium]